MEQNENKINEKEISLQNFPTKTDLKFQNIILNFLEELDVYPIGIDIGYSSSKVLSTQGKFIFPSLPIKMRKDQADFVGETAIKYKDEKGTWYVGELARNSVEWDKQKINSDILYGQKRLESHEYLVLLRVCVALGLMNKAHKITKQNRIKIKTGLPEEQLETDRVTLKKRFEGHHNFEISIGGKGWQKVSFDIEDSKDHQDITVMSQPMGTIWSLAANKQGKIVNRDLFNRNIVVWDGGFYSIDSFLYKQAAKGTNKTWTEFSMNEVYKRTEEDILDKTDEKISNPQLDTYIQHPRFPQQVPYGDDRQFYNFSSNFINNLNDVAEEMVEELRLTYNKFKEVDTMIVTGGTGEAMFDKFKELLPSSLELILAQNKNAKDDIDNFNTVFANVNGFFNALIAELLVEYKKSNSYKVALELAASKANKNK